MSNPHGPYSTSGQATADIANPAGYADRSWRQHALTRALTNAGVTLGEHDRVIVRWLAGWEPDTVQAVIGWIERAHATEVRRAAPVAVDLDAVRERISGSGL